ncbi:hypothetical protein CTI12_AA075200 [Artemisia annua]|uniref:Zinc finger, CCHC-type n=1 Tax=Artemisia annua TaxID=35608 RepID=A0A2U1Q3W3_ARTAN|nr:hypothetical protein CTI12_AA075200 [Artemisia annua]
MNALTLCDLIEKEKLNGSNLLDCHRNLRIILKYEEKLQLTEEPLPDHPAANATPEQVVAYQTLFAEQENVALLMLASMTPELQKDMDDRTTYDMINGRATRDVEDCREECAFQKCRSKSAYDHRWRSEKEVLDKGKRKPKERKKVPPPPKKESVAKDGECFHCEKMGH